MLGCSPRKGNPPFLVPRQSFPSSFRNATIPIRNVAASLLKKGIHRARRRHVPGGYALAITPKAIVFGLAISQLPTDHSFSSSPTELLASAACHWFLSRNRWLLSVALPFAFRRVRIVDAN